MNIMVYQSIEESIGNTPLVQLRHLTLGKNNRILVKLEGNNPSGSVKDRAALNMILQAEKRGDIRLGDVLIEATSGNTGIALAMVAAAKGYKMRLIMPSNMSIERSQIMRAYGAEIILVSPEESMEGARDLARSMQKNGDGIILDQFANQDNPNAHYNHTAVEIWEQTEHKISHFISSMGTTGTIVGVSRYLKEQNSSINIVGLQPDATAKIAGIRCWSDAYLPKIFNDTYIDEIWEISEEEARDTSVALAKREGIFAGISSGGNVAAAIKLSAKLHKAVIVTIICDRGDRYLSTGLYV